MTYYGTHRNEAKAVRSVTARMREQAEERDAESAERRELEATEHAARCAVDPYYAAYGWDEDTIDEPATRRAIESVTEKVEEQAEDNCLDDDEALDDGNRNLPPSARAVDSVTKLMAKKKILTDAEHDAEVFDSLPDADDAERADRVKGAMSTKSAVEMLSDTELRDAMEQGIAADAEKELREEIAAEEEGLDENDDGMGPGARSGGLHV